MSDRMYEEIEREKLQREYYLSRKRDIFERQASIINLMPKLMVPMIFMLIAMMLLEPAQSLIVQYERILTAEANGMERIPELRKEIKILEKQIASLSSKSIENRLGKIEQSIAIGEIDSEQLTTLSELRKDFEILKSYMFSDPKDLVELKTLQRDYKEIAESVGQYVQKDVVDREISFLNNMFYTVLGFLGILISIAGGSWWSTSKKLKAINTEERKET